MRNIANWKHCYLMKSHKLVFSSIMPAMKCSGNFRDMSASDIQNMISVNVKGLTMVQRICSPYFAKDSFAIMTCSVSSFTPIPHQAVYSASKRYIYALGKALREEEKEIM